MTIPEWIFVLPGYLLGSIPFGLLLTRSAGLGDIRAIGSGNIGATNVLRTGSKPLAAATLVLDGGKGAAAVLLAHWAGGFQAGVWAGLGAVIGHLFPVWLGFRGGKGVATGFGVLLAAAWPVGIISGAVWIATAALLRMSSAAALAAFVAAPVLALLLAGKWTILMALAISLLVIARHYPNIRRLIAGTEPKIGEKRDTENAEPSG